VIAAFEDVSNSRRALQADADALAAELEAERSARASLDIAQAQHRLGAIS
jgi:outer membrane protein TolC